MLHEIPLVPGMWRNLLSVYRLASDNINFRFMHDKVSIRKSNFIYARSSILGDLYVLDYHNSMIGFFLSSFMVDDMTFESIKMARWIGPHRQRLDDPIG